MSNDPFMSESPGGRRSKRKWGPPRRLKITRNGWIYLVFTIFIGLAAINTGNNLLFLLLGLLLAGVVLSGVLSESTLRDLWVDRVLPPDAEVDKPCLVGLRITSRKRLSSYAIVARDIIEGGEAGRAFALTIDGESFKDVAYRWVPKKRGRVHFVRVEIATRFPFGLFEKWREIDLPADAVVFPREVPAPMLMPKRAVPFGERPSGQVGPGQEFFALRDIRAGDDARAIHWRTSARRGRPVVVEREKENRRRIAVVVDNRAAAMVVDAKQTDETLDRIAESAAALVRRSLKDGCEVSFSSSDAVVPTGAGSAHERRILRALALLGLSTTEAPPIASRNADVIEVKPENVSRPKERAA
jgi:uncharacterized protein (DUF58 family)